MTSAVIWIFILLDVNDPDDPDFKEFLVRIRKDVESKEIRKEWYDRVESRESLIQFFRNKKAK